MANTLHVRNTLSDKLTEREPAFEYIDIRDYAPAGNPENWFYVPWMGEKLSPAGMEMYSQSVARALKANNKL